MYNMFVNKTNQYFSVNTTQLDDCWVNGKVLTNITNGFNTILLDAGILLSNSVVRKIIPNVDWCVRNAYSASDDDNFGRCVLRSIDLPCQTSIQVCKNKNYFFILNIFIYLSRVDL